MARARTPRTAWVDQALVVLAARGIEAVRVEALAAALGVTKGGFYGYYDGLAQLQEEMLAAWERAVADDVVATMAALPEPDPRARVRRLARLVADDGPVATRLDTEIAVRAWARHDERAAAVLARVDARRAAFLQELFRQFCSPEEADARTAIALSVRLASRTMPLHLPGRTSERVLELVVDELVR